MRNPNCAEAASSLPVPDTPHLGSQVIEAVSDRGAGVVLDASLRGQEGCGSEFVSFLDSDVDIRRVICSGNDREPEGPPPARGSGPRSLPD